MMRRVLFFPLVLLVCLLSLVAGQQYVSGATLAGGNATQQPVMVEEQLFRVDAPPEGEAPLVLVVWLTPAEGYYAYGHEPGETGQPTVLSITPPPGVEAEILYPEGVFKPDAFDPGIMVEVFHERTPIFVALHGDPGASLFLVGELEMLLCSDTSCWPVRHELLVDQPDFDPNALQSAEGQSWWPRYLALSAGEPDPRNLSGADALGAAPLDSIEGADGADSITQGAAGIEALDIVPEYFQPELEVQGVGKAALLAILAGFILNFMPCVLPVVSLKLSTLVAAAGVDASAHKTRGFREHNVFFAVGILIYFVVLGVVLGAAGLAWGQLFQKPGLIMGVTAVVFGLGLSLFGLFDLPIIDLKTGGPSKNPRLQAMFTGLLATLLATPCSGPFLGGVLGWTLTQAPSTIVTVFLCIGLGMALPYILMAFKPGLVRLFPKPGGWTIFLERLVGFFLMGTCVYLLAILPTSYFMSALVLLLAVAFAAWMWGAWTNLADPKGKRLAVRAAALAVVLVVGLWAFQPPDRESVWLPFDAESFTELKGQRNLMVDFTADWCPNCKVLEKTTLAKDNLEGWGERFDLVFVQADLTEDNPEAQALLRKLGSQSIPVVALFPTGDASGTPLVLRDIVTESQLERALQQTFAASDTVDEED